MGAVKTASARALSPVASRSPTIVESLRIRAIGSNCHFGVGTMSFISAIAGAGWSIVQKVGTSIAIKKIERHTPENPIQFVKGPRLYSHLRQLKSTLEAAPFIYRGELSLSVLNDFLDVTHQLLD